MLSVHEEHDISLVNFNPYVVCTVHIIVPQTNISHGVFSFVVVSAAYLWISSW